MRKTRKSHVGYYLASSIVCKDSGTGIYGFRLYDIKYNDYEIFTVNGVKAILNKYPEAIINVKIRDGYLGLCHIGSSNYSIYNRKNELIRKGNKILFNRLGINSYEIIDDCGNIKNVDIREIKDWISANVVIAQDKDKMLLELKNDIDFFNKDFDKFSRKKELLTITGNDYLCTKILTLGNGERVIKAYDINYNARIPEGRIQIPREVGIVHLDFHNNEDIKVIDLRGATKLRSVQLRINKCNLKIIFPNYRIHKLNVEAQESLIEFQNLENAYFSVLKISTVQLVNNSELHIKLVGQKYDALTIEKTIGLKKLKVSGEGVIDKDYFKVYNCTGLEELDASELVLESLGSDNVRDMYDLVKCKLRLNNGYFYVACNRCPNLEELELYGSTTGFNGNSLTYNTPSLRKLRLDMKSNVKFGEDYLVAGNYIIEELVNNSGIKTEKLFNKDYIRICEICKKSEKLKQAYKRFALEPLYKEHLYNEDKEIIGFDAVSYLGPDIGEDNYNKQLRMGVLDIPHEIIRISSRTFLNNNKVAKVIFNGPIRLGNYAFKNCMSLETIVNSEYICAMGEQAFAFDTKLKEFRCGTKLERLSKGAFLMCKSLEKLYISNGMNYCEDYSLFCCVSVELSGYTQFQFTDKTVLNKNYIFKLSNSEIGEIAKYITCMNYCNKNNRLNKIVEFEEIKLLRKMVASMSCRKYIREEYSRTYSKDLDKMLKLIGNMYEYDRGNINKVKITKCNGMSDGDYEILENYYYIVMAKQMSILMKKFKADGLMDNIMESLKV